MKRHSFLYIVIASIILICCIKYFASKAFRTILLTTTLKKKIKLMSKFFLSPVLFCY